jgi:hypothetical protein
LPHQPGRDKKAFQHDCATGQGKYTLLAGPQKETIMKKNVSILAAMISILILLFASESFAQRGMGWKGSGGWGMGTAYGKMYNPKTVETVNGG